MDPAALHSIAAKPLEVIEAASAGARYRAAAAACFAEAAYCSKGSNDAKMMPGTEAALPASPPGQEVQKH